jgi:peptidoglycan/LPS O-acetylase OafA/YrhL
MPSKPDRVRIDALTSLRFLAAIVVIGHFGKKIDLFALSPKLLTSGSQMVTFFFVLSGFVMTLAYDSRMTSSFRAYYVSRIARIAPTDYVALAMSAFFLFGWKDNGLDALAGNATLMQAWLPNYTSTFNIPAWSISVEVVFYALFPFILLVLKTKRPSPLTIILSALGLWALTQAVLTGLLHAESAPRGRTFGRCLILYFPLLHMCSFFLGIGAGLWHVRRDSKTSRSESGTTILMLGTLALIFIALSRPSWLFELAGQRLPLGSSFLAPLFALLIGTVACSRNLLVRALCVSPLILLGEASYGLYILQAPIHSVYNRYIEEHIGLDAQGHFYAYATLLMLASILSLYWVEKPGAKLVHFVADRLPSLRASTPSPTAD